MTLSRQIFSNEGDLLKAMSVKTNKQKKKHTQLPLVFRKIAVSNVEWASRARSCVQRSLDPGYDGLLIFKVRLLECVCWVKLDQGGVIMTTRLRRVRATLLERSHNTLSADPRRCCQIVCRLTRLQCFKVVLGWGNRPCACRT